MAVKRTLISVTVLLAVAALLVLFYSSFTLSARAEADDKTTAQNRTEQLYNDLYVGVMHPWQFSEGPGTCPEAGCGMTMSRVQGHKAGTPAPPLDRLYVSADNPMLVFELNDTSKAAEKKLIPIVESPYYQPRKEEMEPQKTGMEKTGAEKMGSMEMDAMKMGDDEAGKGTDLPTQAKEKSGSGKLYTCGMHPDVITEEPGNCPICGMNLTPVRGSGGSTAENAGASGERRVAYWVAPMDPGFVSDKPGKSPMGMDLVPVYEDELREGAVQIDPITIQSIGVRTEPVERRDLTVTLRTNGTVTVAEDKEFTVNARVMGWVEQLHVSRTGDTVRKGEPLLGIYSPDLVAAQEEFLLALAAGKALDAGGIAPENRKGSGIIEASRKRLLLWDIPSAQIDDLARTKEVTRTMTLVSPANGVVLHKNVIEGSAIKPGMDLFRIADLDTIWIIVQVYEYEMPWVEIGDAVEVYSPYDPALSMSGRVDFVYPTLDPKTRTVDVRVVLQNLGLQLRPEMYVDVRIAAAERKNVVAVPKAAVLRSGERDITFVKRGVGLFEPVEVKLGIETDSYYEITSGLSPGEEVVTAAQFLLDSEAKLQEAVQRRLKQRKQIMQMKPSK